MAVCVSNKVDSNITGLAIAEEDCLKQLPVTPVWFAYEPNSYADMGGDLKTVARTPINPSRQNKKGVITDLDASGGFNTDFTKSNLTRLLQGFFFADAREPKSTKPINAVQIAITAVAATDKSYAAAAGLDVFAVSNLIFASGFGVAANNGLKTVATAVAGKVTVAETLVDEAAPPAAANFAHVGQQLPSGDINMAVTAGVPSLTSTTTDFTTFPGLFPGKWIFLGGDTTATSFANNVGYARVASVAQRALTFDDTTFAPVNETGTAKTIRYFTGIVIKNEDQPSLIKRRSYNIERQLGLGPTAMQAEYLEGAVANELSLNIPMADKLNADLSFVACNNTYRSGEVGDVIKSGTRVASAGEDAYNTSSDIYRIKMNVLDKTTSNPAALFGYVSDAKLTVKNNVTPNKAVGVLGSFDTTAGNFEVDGSITAYFTTVAAVKALRANADVGLSVIGAAKNAGFVFDIPLMGLGGGKLKVEKDKPIEVPIVPAGAQNANGYTMLYQSFLYLPNVAMPV